MKEAPAKKTSAEWNALGERRLKLHLKRAFGMAGLKRVGPKKTKTWAAGIQLIGAPAMTRLNGHYRGKAYPTDVLSFPSPEIFWSQGYLGELVICLPTLKRQAKEHGHSPETELDVLLVHGILHLLGFDHERGRKDALLQARWEQKFLGRKSGLIERMEGKS